MSTGQENQYVFACLFESYCPLRSLTRGKVNSTSIGVCKHHETKNASPAITGSSSYYTNVNINNGSNAFRERTLTYVLTWSDLFEKHDSWDDRSRSGIGHNTDIATEVATSVAYRVPGSQFVACYMPRGGLTMVPTAHLARVESSTGISLLPLSPPSAVRAQQRVEAAIAAPYPVRNQPSWPMADSLSPPRIELSQDWALLDVIFEERHECLTQDYSDDTPRENLQPLLDSTNPSKLSRQLGRERI